MPEPSDEITIRVLYGSEWSSAVGTASSTRSVDGSVDTTIDIGDNSASIVSANAQKQDDSSAELTVQILLGGEVAEETSTTAGFSSQRVSLSVG